jgi:hypothetical protein
MAPPKGSTNNPRGRPKKGRALTDQIVKALEVADPTNNRPRKEVMAELIAQAITTATVTFPDGLIMQLSVKDWLDLLKWAITQIDGPAARELDVTSGGEPIPAASAKTYIGFSPDEWDAIDGSTTGESAETGQEAP